MTITVYPAEGRRVRDPASGQPIPSDGLIVQPSPYWNRRLQDEDVFIEATVNGVIATETAAPKSARKA